jgi:hypothetical protein
LQIYGGTDKSKRTHTLWQKSKYCFCNAQRNSTLNLLQK